MNFDVNVYPLTGGFNSKTKAFATIIIDNVFEVKGFKIVEGRNGLFVSMPQTKGTDKATGQDKWYPDVIFREDKDPENKIYRGPVQETVEKAMLDKYAQMTGNQPRGNAANAQTKLPSPTQNRPSSPFGTDGPAW